MPLGSRTNMVLTKNEKRQKNAIGLKRREMHSLLLRYPTLFLFSCVFLLGIAGGAVVGGFTKGILLEKLDFLFHASYLCRSTDACSTIFISSFASSFVFALAFLLMALSVWGFLCIPILLFFRGFGAGLTGGYLYITFGWKGFFYHFLTILPGACLCGIALLLAAKESWKISHCIRMQKQPDYTLFFNRFGIVLCLLFLSALLDMGTNFCFAGLFSFDI